jgi:hypothetical protein
MQHDHETVDGRDHDSQMNSGAWTQSSAPHQGIVPTEEIHLRPEGGRIRPYALYHGSTVRQKESHGALCACRHAQRRDCIMGRRRDCVMALSGEALMMGLSVYE